MGLSVWSLIAYISAIIIWNAVFKRNIGEAMGIGWIVVLLFGGSKMGDLFWQSIMFSARQETIFAALSFVFMAYVMGKTGLIMRMVNILNSTLGRVPGGAAFSGAAPSGRPRSTTPAVAPSGRPADQRESASPAGPWDPG